MASGSKLAVYTAIGANSLVTVAKVGGFLATGSGAMLSEAIHSFADVCNQSLLALGIKRSERPADEEHPYGYGRAQFVWSLISGVGIFFIGCGVTTYHGVQLLLHPHPIESIGIALWIMLFAFVVEFACLLVAMRVIKKAAGDSGFWNYVLHGPDPMAVAVLLEDSAAVLGVMIASAGIALTMATGNSTWDAVASISIGILLGMIALFIIWKAHGLLLGKQMPGGKQQQITELLANDDVVEAVIDPKSALLGPTTQRFKAEIDFDGRAIADRVLDDTDLTALHAQFTSPEATRKALQDFGEAVVTALGVEIDRLEAKVQELVPEAEHVDLEAD
jgi:zinc transporter 9